MPNYLALILAASLAVPLPAFAQSPASGTVGATPLVSAGQAAALQDEIRGFIGGLFGKPGVTVPVQVTQEGDHYRLAMPLGGLPGWTGAGALTATAHPLAGGRWAIDDVRFPQPAAVRIALPATKTHPAGPLNASITIRDQDGHAVIDPSLATPSTWTSRIGGYDMVFAGPGTRGVQHIDSGSSEGSLMPAANGRLDVTETGAAHGVSLTQAIGAGGTPLQLSASGLALSAHLDGIDAPRLLPAIHALTRFGADAAASAAAQKSAGAGAAAATPTADRVALRALYLAWRGMATGGALEESVDGIHLIAAGHQVGLDHIAIGGGATTAGGTLAAHLGIAVDGLTSPEIPAALREFVPHHIALQPSLSAIDLADLDALIMGLTDPNTAHVDPAPLIAALFTHGGIVAGIDALALDVGPAELTGTGKVIALAPDRLEADAVLRMTGFDALAQDINAVPAFAQAGPIIVMARGLARPEGDAMVWHITSKGGDVRVNDTDLSALLGQAMRQQP